MDRIETTEQVKLWFQGAVRDLWPVAVGSLSLRKSPCIRKGCQDCKSGRGHSSYALYGRKGDRRFSIYVPDELAEDLERAIRNGRDLQKLMTEAGRRYTLALKNERVLRNRTGNFAMRSPPDTGSRAEAIGGGSRELPEFAKAPG
jgi:hypothetical protein